MDANDFFRIHKKELDEKIEFQQRIDNLDQDSIDDLIQEIKSKHCNDKEVLRITLYMIRKGAFSHPKNIFLYLRLIEEIIDSIKFFFTGDELALIFRFISNKLIFLKLYNLGAIEFKSVFKMIKNFHSNLSYNEPLIYFYPEIKRNANDIYLKLRSFVNKELTSSLLKDQEEEKNKSKGIIHEKSSFSIDSSKNESSSQLFLCDDPVIEKKFIEFREAGMSLDPIAIAIRNDDIEKFQSILSKTNTSVNDCVKYSIFEQCYIVSKRRERKTLRFIEYAAFFGSVNIFKFLLNTAELTEKVAKSAVKGGNYEIIHLCEQYKINFPPKCITLAIRFHHNEIVDYFLDNYPFSIDVGTTIASIQYYNWEMMTRYIPIYLNPNPNISNDNFSALATASINGYLDIVQILCSLKNIDINFKSEGWNAVMYAAFKGYVNILKYFMSHFKSVDSLNDADDSNNADIEKSDNNENSHDDNEKNNENTDNHDNSHDDNEKNNENTDNHDNSHEDNKNNNENTDNDENSLEDNENKKENTDNHENSHDNANNTNENTNEDKDNANNQKELGKITNIIDLNQKWDDRSPIEIAIYSDELNVVKYLLQFKTVFEDSKKNIEYLILISQRNQSIEIEQYLREVFHIEN